VEDYHLKGIPTFRINDYKVAISFYIDFLGFKIDWEHRFSENEPIYMQISKNGLILHLSENQRFKTGAIVFVETVGLEELRKTILKSKYDEIIPEILSTDWGTKQLEIEDPFGNLLRFNEN